MDKKNILIIALLVLIFLGMVNSKVYKPTVTTSKTVVIKTPPHYGRYVI